MCLGSLMPSGVLRKSWYSPDSSEKYATHLPSGDHAGSRSITAGVLVKLRISPFSAGAVRTPPWASNTARAPLGESRAVSISLSTFLKCGRTLGRSAGTVTETVLDLPVTGSKRLNDPNCSYTIALGPAAADLMSAPLPGRACSTFLLLES